MFALAKAKLNLGAAHTRSTTGVSVDAILFTKLFRSSNGPELSPGAVARGVAGGLSRQRLSHGDDHPVSQCEKTPIEEDRAAPRHRQGPHADGLRVQPDAVHRY